MNHLTMVMEDRPEYRLEHIGPSAMTTAELLGIMFGGPTGHSKAVALLQRISHPSKSNTLTTQELTALIGKANIPKLKAYNELALRHPAPPQPYKIDSPNAVASLFMPKLGPLLQEELWAAILNTRNDVISTTQIYKGSLNTSVVRVAEVLRPAIVQSAAAIVVVHNHPSGDCSPSPEDVATTRELVAAGKLLGIQVLDHIIVSSRQYVSLKERGLGFG